MNEMIVPRRFCGPPDSGNGGWTAGALAAHLRPASPDGPDGPDGWPTIEVSLRQPPPLDTPMLLTEEGGVTTAERGGVAVANARRVERALHEVASVPFGEARAAEAAYAGHTFHPFPTCFACGTGREEGDGLRIFPGVVPGERVAATWRPHPSQCEDEQATLPVTWAALDCVGGWAGDLTERLMVLGRMTARLHTVPLLDQDHVVVGAKLGAEGRKTFTAATLYDSQGRVVASAEHVWIAVDAAAFGGVRPA